jgi:hypothetical protein
MLSEFVKLSVIAPSPGGRAAGDAAIFRFSGRLTSSPASSIEALKSSYAALVCGE